MQWVGCWQRDGSPLNETFFKTCREREKFSKHATRDTGKGSPLYWTKRAIKTSFGMQHVGRGGTKNYFHGAKNFEG